MGRRLALLTLVAVAVMGGTAAAGSRWLITSTHQIKPSVLSQLKAKLLTKQVLGPAVTVYPEGTAAGSPGQSTANCPAGYSVVGGGWQQGQIPITVSSVDDSEASGNGWFVQMENDGSTQPGIFRAVAECAKT